MPDHRGRPRTLSPRGKGAVAVSSGQRVLLGTVVNVAALIAWAAEAMDRRHVSSSQWSGDGGTSRAGLRSKKPTGASRKPVDSTGMTGQSSGRGM